MSSLKYLQAACFGLALIAEIVAVVLIVKDGRRARDALKRFLAANPNNSPAGTYSQLGELHKVISTILENQIVRLWAVGLIVFGILVGSLGNFLGLA